MKNTHRLEITSGAVDLRPDPETCKPKPPTPNQNPIEQQKSIEALQSVFVLGSLSHYGVGPEIHLEMVFVIISTPTCWCLNTYLHDC